jgi:hypothetical protein
MGSYDFEALTVIISSLGSALAGTPDAKFNSCFTGDCNPEKKSPIEERATIIGLVYNKSLFNKLCQFNKS